MATQNQTDAYGRIATLVIPSYLTEREARVLTTSRGPYRYGRTTNGGTIRYRREGDMWVSF